MNKIAHELKLLRRALAAVETHLDNLDREIAVQEVPTVYIDDRDVIIIVNPCDDEYHMNGDHDEQYYLPPEEKGSDGS